MATEDEALNPDEAWSCNKGSCLLPTGGQKTSEERARKPVIGLGHREKKNI